MNERFYNRHGSVAKNVFHHAVAAIQEGKKQFLSPVWEWAITLKVSKIKETTPDTKQRFSFDKWLLAELGQEISRLTSKYFYMPFILQNSSLCERFISKCWLHSWWPPKVAIAVGFWNVTVIARQLELSRFAGGAKGHKWNHVFM